MKPNTILQRMVVMLITLMCALGANAAEAYACYTSSDNTLTFYYDDLRSTREGTTYDLYPDKTSPGWYKDGTYEDVTKVVFDPSFADARPTTTYSWFYRMMSLQTIEGLRYLNTSEVTTMEEMFFGCTCFTSLDLSSFNTSKVTNMDAMFMWNRDLQTIYVGSGWSTAAVTKSEDMFFECRSLEGSQGTTYDYTLTDKTYAHIDGGTENPGYLTRGSEAYAVYNNATLTFYYDNQLDSHTGVYYLKTEAVAPGWFSDNTNANVTQVVFDPSFAKARPSTTYCWFSRMGNLQTITNIGFLNTSEVISFASMFASCKSLTYLDLSHFNTGMATDMRAMFSNCENLQTIYVGDGWTTGNVTDTYSLLMFNKCNSLVGGQGTTWKDTNPSDVTYARIDEGTSKPGYFTYKNLPGISTGVAPQVTSDKSQVTSESWYTIDGRKLNGVPTKKGIYIHNGRAVVH